MRIVDVGEDAHGLIAFGQFATGVVAVGQVATGVIAIGQVARGVVAIGQVSFGLWSIGMGSAGLFSCVAMAGVGGRGLGLVIPLIPRLGPAPALPELATGPIGRSGWLRATVSTDGEGPRVEAGGELLRVDASLRVAIERAAAGGPVVLLARACRRGDELVVDRLMAIPASPWGVPANWALWGAQLAGLVALAVAFAALVAVPVAEGVLAALRP